MTRPPSRAGVFALAALVAATSAGPATAASKKKNDNYVHPDFASFQIRSIAILPPAVLPPVANAGETMGRQLERNLSSLGYRWVSAAVLRRTVSQAEHGVSLDALVDGLRKSAALDTAGVKAIGAAGVADAILGTLISNWERETIDITQTGQSLTQIGLQEFLYSTRTGELLWSRRFQIKGEGPYNNPGDGSGVMGVKSGGFETGSPQTSTSLEPPTYEEVAARAAVEVRSALPPPPAKPAP